MCREESGDWLAGVAVLVAVCLWIQIKSGPVLWSKIKHVENSCCQGKEQW